MGNKIRSKSTDSLREYIIYAYKLTKDATTAKDNSILVYVVLISVITLLRRLLPDFALQIAALLMFTTPFLMRSRVTGLKWNLNGVLLGVIVSIVVISIYVIIVDKPLQLRRVSYTILTLQLFLVALPEEVFFRGYLQEKIGNNIKGVLIVSLLFAIAHFIVACIGGGYGGIGCLKTLLTFFPSIIMGFMYAKSGTLWGNIIFHFLANVVYNATGGL